ncbi:hypothetical protein KL86CLO1_10559 [uncultured Eubacteriales bacterium]|uniref:Uncharacterized protein n=1 Tax=uncultured Eubacteriales bacterium TaxID=172733 RepID=A0A212J5S2_9FIRM|nr:hypothetical protein KL86CLO1_10559 [uncultured Eubacteriales bacterium]
MLRSLRVYLLFFGIHCILREQLREYLIGFMALQMRNDANMKAEIPTLPKR